MNIFLNRCRVGLIHALGGLDEVRISAKEQAEYDDYRRRVFAREKADYANYRVRSLMASLQAHITVQPQDRFRKKSLKKLLQEFGKRWLAVQSTIRPT